MRRAWRRSARMRARVVLPTRKGPSMTIKRGGWRLRCGTRARLAAEESLPGIVSCDHGRAGINKRIIAESRTQSSGVCAYSMGVSCGGKKVKHFHIYVLVLPFEKTQTAELEEGTNKNVTNGCCGASPDLFHPADGRRGKSGERFASNSFRQRDKRFCSPCILAIRASTQGENRCGADRSEPSGAAFSAGEAGVHAAAGNTPAEEDLVRAAIGGAQRRGLRCLVNAQGSRGRVRAGGKSVSAPVREFERDLCGNAGEPSVYGLPWQAHDGEPARLGAEDVVGAAGSGCELLIRGGRT